MAGILPVSISHPLALRLTETLPLIREPMVVVPLKYIVLLKMQKGVVIT